MEHDNQQPGSRSQTTDIIYPLYKKERKKISHMEVTVRLCRGLKDTSLSKPVETKHSWL